MKVVQNFKNVLASKKDNSGKIIFFKKMKKNKVASLALLLLTCSLAFLLLGQEKMLVKKTMAATETQEKSASFWQKVKQDWQKFKENFWKKVSEGGGNVGKRPTSWTEDLQEIVKGVYDANYNGNNDVVKRIRAKDREIIDGQRANEVEYAGGAKRALQGYLVQNKKILEEKVNARRKIAEGENGTPENPFYMEPNMFKKYCGENKYVLYWRIAGSSGRDLANPVTTGVPAGEQSVWRVPTCEELAACHCCANLCTNTVLRKIGKAWVLVCLPNVGFGVNGECSPLCKAPIGRAGCDGYSGSEFGSALDHDCMIQVEGCMDGSAGCTIIIKDPGNSQFQYTKGPNSDVYIHSRPGDNVVPPGAKVRKDNGADALPYGWIGQLVPEPGKCCKCIQR